MTKIKLQAFRTTAAKTKGGRGPGGTEFHCKPLKRFDPEKKMKGNERNSACFRSILEHHFASACGLAHSQKGELQEGADQTTAPIRS
jgi:hypothetical protein